MRGRQHDVSPQFEAKLECVKGSLRNFRCTKALTGPVICQRRLQSAVQSSNRSPSILENSLVLWVTKVTSRDSAWAPINVSRGPIGCPFASSDARTLP